ncbi:RodZ domain-containing protein [Bisgaard Taxon 45]
MNTATNTIEEKALTLGEQFRQAREAQQLSIEDVSKKISLRPSILQLIETNQFAQKSIPATFMRGYVRSYAKFLKLPESVWVHASFGEDHKNDLGKNARATRAVNNYSSHNHWIGWLSLLVVVIVAGMTGLWWWENYTQSNAERESLVQNYVETTPQNTLVPNTTLMPSSSTSHTQSANEIAPPTLTPVELSVSATAVPVTITPLNEAPITSAEVLKAEMNKLDEKNVNPLVSTETASSTTDELHIEVTGGCWISVQNDSGKVLAQKEYKQGDVLTFNEGVTYSLIIGAPANVKITYKGEDYPLKVDGRVARFKLPQ